MYHRKQDTFTNYDYDKGIEYGWFVGSFKGKDAERMVAYADNRMGVIILEKNEGRGITKSCVAVVKRPITDATPPHLVQVTDQNKLEQYDRITNPTMYE